MSSKRALIVVSSYKPAMASDMHRARMLCFDLPQQGWDVEILTPDVSYQRPITIDPDVEGFFCESTPVHSVPAWHAKVFRVLSVGGIAWRAGMPLHREGSRLLRTGRFDLVYFSTTQFQLMCLGPIWRKRFGVPYVLDLQDPWYHPSRKYYTTDRVAKARITNSLHKRSEPFAVRNADALVSVSAKYLDDLNERYHSTLKSSAEPWRQQVIPFAASKRDLDRVSDIAPSPTSNPLRIAYVGVGGVTHVASGEALCAALARLRAIDPSLLNRTRFCLHGTIGPKVEKGVIQSIAEAHGVGDLVEEHTERVSYYESLRLAAEADGLLIIGVDDRGYIPSKLFSYLLFGKPVLAAFFDDSPAVKLLEQYPGAASLIRFGGEHPTTTDEAARIVQSFLQDVNERRRTDRSALVEPYLAPAMARRHAELFDRVVAEAGKRGA
jgi:hypothetical protein